MWFYIVLKWYFHTNLHSNCYYSGYVVYTKLKNNGYNPEAIGIQPIAYIKSKGENL